jgi:uncharacterized membrane protein YgcG
MFGCKVVNHKRDISIIVLIVIIISIGILIDTQSNTQNIEGLATLSAQELPQRYIIQLPDNDEERVGILNTPNRRDFNSVPLSVIVASEQELASLKAQGIIEDFYEDELVYFGSTRASDRMTKTHKIPQLMINGQVLDGTGQGVCIVDSGLNTNHPLLNTDQIVNTQCLIEGFSAPGIGYCPDGTTQSDEVTDYTGHGTAIIGLFASAEPTVPGLTPGANVVGLQIYNPDYNVPNTFWTSDILTGMEYCIDNAEEFGITAMSFSFGPTNYMTTQQHCLSSHQGYLPLLEQAYAKNITLFAGSGNFADTSCPTCDGWPTYQLGQPACQTIVNSVGSVSSSEVENLIEVSRYANRGPMLDFLAPGQSIQTLDVDGDLTALTGTSFASPYLTAMGMLLQQKEKILTGHQPHPDRVRELLQETSIQKSDEMYTYDLPIFTLPIEVEQEQSGTNTTFTYTINPDSVFYLEGTTTCDFIVDNQTVQTTTVNGETTDTITITENMEIPTTAFTEIEFGMNVRGTPTNSLQYSVVRQMFLDQEADGFDLSTFWVRPMAGDATKDYAVNSEDLPQQFFDDWVSLQDEFGIKIMHIINPNENATKQRALYDRWISSGAELHAAEIGSELYLPKYVASTPDQPVGGPDGGFDYVSPHLTEMTAIKYMEAIVPPYVEAFKDTGIPISLVTAPKKPDGTQAGEFRKQWNVDVANRIEDLGYDNLHVSYHIYETPTDIIDFNYLDTLRALLPDGTRFFINEFGKIQDPNNSADPVVRLAHAQREIEIAQDIYEKLEPGDMLMNQVLYNTASSGYGLAFNSNKDGITAKGELIFDFFEQKQNLQETNSPIIPINPETYSILCTNSTDTLQTIPQNISAGETIIPPQVEFTNINENDIRDDPVTTFYFRATHDKDVDYCQFSMNGDVVEEINFIVLGVNMQIQAPNELTGIVDIAIDCWDYDNVKGSDALSYIVGEAPEVSTIDLQVANGWQNTNEQNVEIDVFAPAGISWCALLIDGDVEINSTISNTNLSTTESLTVPDGLHTIELRCIDTVGATLSTTENIQVDTLPPVTTLTGFVNGSLATSPVTFTLSAVDTGSGVTQTTYNINGEGATSYTNPVSISESGQYTITYNSQDVANNQETPREQVVVIVISEVVNFVLNEPTTGIYSTPMDVNFEVTDGADIHIYLNNTLILSGTDQQTFTVEPDQDGIYVLRVEANISNTINSSSALITYDTTPPQIEASADNQSNILTVTIVAEDALTDITSVTVDNQATNQLNSNTYTREEELEEGENTFTIRAIDEALNQQTQEISYTYTLPQINETNQTNPVNETNTTNQTNPTVPNVTTSLDDISITAPENITINLLKNTTVPVSLQGAIEYYTIRPSAAFTRASIMFTYSSNDFRGYTESTMNMFRFDETEQEWIPLSTDLAYVHELELDTVAKTIYAEVSSFSTYTYSADKRTCELNDNNQVEQDCYDGELFVEDGSYYCDENYQDDACEQEGSSSNGGGGGGSSGGSSSGGSSSSSSSSQNTVDAEEPTEENETSEIEENETNPTTVNVTGINNETNINITTANNATNASAIPPIEATPQPVSKRTSKQTYILAIILLVIAATASIFIYEKKHHEHNAQKVESIGINVEDTPAENPEQHTQLDKKH